MQNYSACKRGCKNSHKFMQTGDILEISAAQGRNFGSGSVFFVIRSDPVIYFPPVGRIRPFVFFIGRTSFFFYGSDRCMASQIRIGFFSELDRFFSDGSDRFMACQIRIHFFSELDPDPFFLVGPFLSIGWIRISFWVGLKSRNTCNSFFTKATEVSALCCFSLQIRLVMLLSSDKM